MVLNITTEPAALRSLAESRLRALPGAPAFWQIDSSLTHVTPTVDVPAVRRHMADRADKQASPPRGVPR